MIRTVHGRHEDVGALTVTSFDGKSL